MTTHKITDDIDLFIELQSYRNIKDDLDAQMEAERIFSETGDLKVVDAYCKQVFNKPYIDQLLLQSQIKKRFQGCSLDNFEVYNDTCTRARKQALKYIERMDENLKKGINLIISGYGKTDTGKTHIACAIANKMIESRIPVRYINVTSMFDKLRKNFDLSEYEEACLLIIDDLGKEKQSDWVSEQLYAIANHRYEEMRPSIITTELSLADLNKRYGDAIFRRLTSLHILIKLDCERYTLKNLTK